jgi:hypothetical protein
MKISGKLDIYLLKLISIEFSDRKRIISGFLLDYSEDWILLKTNPVDYIIDGFTIVRNKHIEEIYQDETEEFAEAVISLKGITPVYEEKIPLDTIQEIFRYLNSKYEIFAFTYKSEKSIYPGRLINIDDKKIRIEWIDTRAQWVGERKFKLDKIRAIEFDNDYLNSLKLASEYYNQ